MAAPEPTVELTRKRPKSRRRLRLAVNHHHRARGGRGRRVVQVVRGKGEDGARIRTAPVTPRDISDDRLHGHRGRRDGADVRIGSQISGRIKRLYADLDQQVTAGAGDR